MSVSSGTDRLRILVLTFTPINSEPRALKQITRLSRDHEVVSAGFGHAVSQDIAHIELDAHPPEPRFVFGLALLLRWYSFVTLRGPRPASARPRLAAQSWDIIIAHDVLTVPLARSLQPRIGVLADLHEYAPRQDEHSGYFRWFVAPLFRWILRKHVTKCAAVTTVSQGIVDEYRRSFGIESTLVVNATPYRELAPTAVRQPIRLVHSGIPAPHRKLEVMIDAVRQTSTPVTLDFFLMPSDEAYLAFLRQRAGEDPRIRFRDPVAYTELIDTLHGYDLGLSLIAPTTFNLAHCLPNKFFDFVQARLGVVSGPSPEMVSFIERYGFGVVTEDFSADALSNVLDSLTPARVSKLKQAAHACAAELSGEHQADIWATLVQRLAVSASENVKRTHDT